MNYSGKNKDTSIGVRHYKENLDGSLVDSFDYRSLGGSFNITDKYYGYHAYAYMNGRYDPPTFNRDEMKKVTKDSVKYGDYYGTLNIFHRRTTSYIYLENINSTNINIGKFYRINGTKIDQNPTEYSKLKRFFAYDNDGYDGVLFEEKLADLNLPSEETLDSTTYMPKSLDKYGDTKGYTPNFLEKYRLVDRSAYYQCRITVTVTAAYIARRCLSRLAQSIPECCFAFG